MGPLKGEDAVDTGGGEGFGPARHLVGFGHEQGIDQHRQIVDGPVPSTDPTAALAPGHAES